VVVEEESGQVALSHVLSLESETSAPAIILPPSSSPVTIITHEYQVSNT